MTKPKEVCGINERIRINHQQHRIQNQVLDIVDAEQPVVNDPIGNSARSILGVLDQESQNGLAGKKEMAH